MNNFIKKIPKKDMGIALCLFLFFLCITLSTYNLTSGFGDLGEYLNNPVRILYGEIPYRDFWLILPPMEVLIPAAIYKIFGTRITLLLFINSIVSALAGAYAFIAGRVLFAQISSAILFSFLFFFDSALYYYAGYNHSNWFLLFLIAGVYLFVRYLKNGEDLFLINAGVMMALASCFRIYEAIPFYSGVIITIIFFPNISWKSRLQKIILFIASTVVLWGMIGILFFSAEYRTMAEEILINSVHHANASYSESFGDIQGDIRSLIKYDNSPWRASYYGNNLVRHSLNYLLIIITGIGGISLFLRTHKKEKEVITWLLVWELLSLGKAFEGIESAIVSFAIIPAFLIGIFLMERKATSFAWGLLSILIFSSVYNVAGEWSAKITKNIYPIRSSAGTLYSDDKKYAEETEGIIKKIENATERHDYIAVLHKMPYPFFATTRRRNATYYDSLIDLFYQPSSSKEQAICNSIRTKKIKLIIVEPAIMNENSSFITLRTCIRKSFTISSVYDNYLVYE